MKILVVCQYYYPEPFRHPDICEELVKRGHEVTVLTGLPNYPMGYVYDGYCGAEKKHEVIRGVKVHRCYTIGRKRGGIYRFLNYYSYAISSSMYARKLPGDYDLVYVHQLSPVMMASAAIRYKKNYQVPLLLYCLDLWPESLTAGGIRRNSLIYRLFHKISENIYQSADRILVTSQSFQNYFRDEFGITETEYLPQYAEDIFVPEQCVKKADDYLDLMFAGNVGAAQNVEVIIRAAEQLKEDGHIRWHIVGDGSEIDKIRDMAKSLRNVFFHGRKELEKMPEYYAMADAMLVTMKQDSLLSMTVPGKLQTYMAAGKPVIGAIDGETPVVIQRAGCGLCGPAEDEKALAENVRKFIQLDHIEMGRNARSYYETHFGKQEFICHLEQVMRDMLEKETI